MRLGYAGVCRACQGQVPARAEEIYEWTTKTIECINHDAMASAPVEPAAVGLLEGVVVDFVESGTAGGVTSASSSDDGEA